MVKPHSSRAESSEFSFVCKSFSERELESALISFCFLFRCNENNKFSHGPKISVSSLSWPLSLMYLSPCPPFSLRSMYTSFVYPPLYLTLPQKRSGGDWGGCVGRDSNSVLFGPEEKICTRTRNSEDGSA